MFPGAIHVQAPTPVPRPPVDPGRQPFELWLETETGATYALDDTGESGVILMRGVRGLGMPPFTHHKDAFASLPGAYHRGYRTESREVFLPIYLFHDGDSQAWVEHDAAWWKAHSPKRQLRLFCRAPDGKVRWLDLRYTKGGEEAYELDPSFYGWAKYGVYYEADFPFWQGDPVKPPAWGAALPRHFFGGGTAGPTAGPPFGIARPSTASAIRVTNPGDEASWPIWTLRGPMPVVGGYAARVGLGGRTIDVPFELTSEDTLVIDTRPTEQSAILNGSVDKTPDLASYGFAQIDEGEGVDLTVLISGIGGSVSVEIPTLYHKAWG